MIMDVDSPIISHLQAGDPGEPVVEFQSESEDLRTRRPDGVSLVQVWRPENQKF